MLRVIVFLLILAIPAIMTMGMLGLGGTIIFLSLVMLDKVFLPEIK